MSRLIIKPWKLFDRRNIFQCLPVVITQDHFDFISKFNFVILKINYQHDEEHINPEVLDEKSLAILEKPNSFLLFSHETEGDERVKYEVSREKIIEHYRLPLEKVIYFTSNLIAKSYPYQTFRWNFFADDVRRMKIFDSRKEEQNFDIEKNFLCFNYTIRLWRTYSIYKLLKSGLQDDCFLSHTAFGKKDTIYFPQFPDMDIDFFMEQVINYGPRIVDWTKRNKNPVYTFPDEFFKSACNIANESLVAQLDSIDQIFYTEKSYKSMRAKQPHIIVGQKNINRYYQKLGFVSYEKCFDLSFDDIDDDKQRIDLIYDQLTYLNKELNKLSPAGKKDWMNKEKDALDHNDAEITKNTYNIQTVESFVDFLSKNR